jgi:tetratricopeptide (TPR) repeat protein
VIRSRHLGLALAAALLALLGAVATAPPAHAQTAAQIEQAKKAFAEGKALFDKGRYEQAVEKFKDSYRLSRNPLLLYNIALTFERLDAKDMALFYYRKFLTDAPADAAQRDEAQRSVAALEKHFAPTVERTPEPEPVAAVEEPRPRRPAAACTIEEIQHQVVEDAPPGRPLDLTAFVPDTCGWQVTLFWRGAGADTFTAAPMRPRYHELVARIPAAAMRGNAIQYYVEIKNADGESLHRIGRSTSPNVVYLDDTARPRFYPDLEETVGRGGDQPPRRDRFADDEDPLAGKRQAPPPRRSPPSGGGSFGGGGGGGGGIDVESSSFRYAKWGSTGATGGMVVLSATFYLMARSWADSLEGEAFYSNDSDCPDRGGPPCRTFDDHRRGIEATGRRYQTLSRVTFGLGVAASAVAGYLWYTEIRAGKQGERVGATTTGLDSLVVAPLAGDGILGGAAALRF